MMNETPSVDRQIARQDGEAEVVQLDSLRKDPLECRSRLVWNDRRCKVKLEVQRSASCLGEDGILMLLSLFLRDLRAFDS